MKKLFMLSCLLLTVVFTTSCEKETTALPENSELNKQLTENEKHNAKLERFNQNLIDNPRLKVKNQLAAREQFTYLSQLCGETISAEHNAGIESAYDFRNWDYYYFNGNEGDVISIYVPRTSQGMDPAFTLYFGTTTNFEEIGLMDENDNFAYFDPLPSSENLEFLAIRDDEVPNPYSYSRSYPCYGDPQLLDYTLPYTGSYTLAIFNWGGMGCGESYTYEIQTTGIYGGVIFPEETVSIDGCNYGVLNRMTSECGVTMSDRIDALAGVTTYKNHGQFVREMAILTVMWEDEGLITQEEKDLIMQCAGESSIGDKK